MKLSTDSQNLLNTYKKAFMFDKTDLEISPTTLKVFSEFYYLFLSSKRHTDLKLLKPIELKTLPRPDDDKYLYIIENIRIEIETTFNSFYKFSYQLNHRKITIYISGKDIKEQRYKNILYKIIFWLKVITTFTSNDNCSRDLSIYLYLCNQKKSIPSNDNEILGKNHVNTGFTYTCVPISQIIIYRIEEWYKVFIHETIHNFGLDFSQNDISTECILKTFKVHSEVNLYEAYTDSWARILNILACVFNSQTNISLDTFQKQSHTYILYETIHSFIQTYKILNKMGLEYKDLFDEKKGYELFKEQTNVLAYYVINSILYSDYQSFIKWCCNNNNTNILQFNSKNQIKFCEYVTNKHKSNTVLKDIGEIKKFLENERTSLFISKNMRKSMIECINL